MPAGNDEYEPRVFIDFRWPAFASFIFVSVIGKRRRRVEWIRDYAEEGGEGARFLERVCILGHVRFASI